MAEPKEGGSWISNLLGLPDLTPRQWRAVWLNLLLEVIGEYGTLVGSLSLASVQSSLELPKDGLSIISAMTSLASTVGVTWALMTDVYGRRIFFRIGVPLAALNEIMNGLAPTGFWWAMAGCFAKISPPTPGPTYLIEELGPKGRGAIAALIGLGGGIGAAVALGVWAVVGRYEWGWRAMSILKSVPLLYLWVRIACDPEYVPESRCFAPPKEGGLAGMMRPVKSLFGNWRHCRVLLVWCLQSVIFGVTYSSPGKFIYVKLQGNCGYSSEAATGLTILAGAFALPLVVLTGTASDRVGRICIAQIIWVLGGFAYALYYVAPCDSWALIVGFILVVCFPQFCRITITSMVANELWQTEHRSFAGAVSGVLGSLFGAVGFIAFPVLAESHGQGHAEAMLGLASISLALVWGMLPETAGRRMNNLNDPQPDNSGAPLDEISAAADSAEETSLVARLESHPAHKTGVVQNYGSIIKMGSDQL